MRLFPPEPEIGPEEGFTPQKDIFGRKEFGNQLTRIVNSLEDPTVLLLDAPWGTGKTTFVKMWCGELASVGIPTIYFDAFKHDYHQDAFLALAGEVIARADAAQTRPTKVVKSFKKTAVTVAKVLTRASVRIGVRVGTAGLLTGAELEDAMEAGKEVAKEVGEATADVVEKLLEERLESHNKNTAAFVAFSAALTNLAAALTNTARGTPQALERPSPLVFIVDELDRCRPSFALELLEKIKHFFAARGVMFVLVSSLTQLESAVRFAYGDIDARTYLEKFYHLRVLLPASTRHRFELAPATYLRHLLSGLPNAAVNFGENVGQLLDEFANLRELSLRTLERICSYIVLFAASTTENQFRPPELIAGLSAMKVLAPELYSLGRAGKLTYAEAEAFFKFASWKATGEPEKQSRAGKYMDTWWRFALGEPQGPDAQSIGQYMARYGFRYPSQVIPWACEFLDGFALPGRQ